MLSLIVIFRSQCIEQNAPVGICNILVGRSLRYIRGIIYLWHISGTDLGRRLLRVYLRNVHMDEHSIHITRPSRPPFELLETNFMLMSPRPYYLWGEGNVLNKCSHWINKVTRWREWHVASGSDHTGPQPAGLVCALQPHRITGINSPCVLNGEPAFKTSRTNCRYELVIR